jgi:hypothetical protein
MGLNFILKNLDENRTGPIKIFKTGTSRFLLKPKNHTTLVNIIAQISCILLHLYYT